MLIRDTVSTREVGDLFKQFFGLLPGPYVALSHCELATLGGRLGGLGQAIQLKQALGAVQPSHHEVRLELASLFIVRQGRAVVAGVVQGPGEGEAGLWTLWEAGDHGLETGNARVVGRHGGGLQ